MVIKNTVSNISEWDIKRWLDDAFRYAEYTNEFNVTYDEIFYNAVCDKVDKEPLSSICAKVLDKGGEIRVFDPTTEVPASNLGFYDYKHKAVAYPVRQYHVKQGFEKVLNRDWDYDKTDHDEYLLETLVRWYNGHPDEFWQSAGTRARYAYYLLQVVFCGKIIRR